MLSEVPNFPPRYLPRQAGWVAGKGKSEGGAYYARTYHLPSMPLTSELRAEALELSSLLSMRE